MLPPVSASERKVLPSASERSAVDSTEFDMIDREIAILTQRLDDLEVVVSLLVGKAIRVDVDRG